MVPLIYAGVNGLLDPLAVEDVVPWDAAFQAHLVAEQKDLLKEIGGGKMTPELEAKIKKTVVDHVQSFNDAKN